MAPALVPSLLVWLLAGACTAPSPAPCDAAVAQGRALIAAGRYDQALAQLAAARRDAAPCPSALVETGNLYARLGRLAAAETAYRSALDLAPEEAQTRHNLAVVLADRGRHPEAVALLEETIAAHSDFLPALLTLALLRVKEGRYDRAASLLLQGAESDSSAVEFLWQLGKLATRQGDYAQAERYLLNAVGRDSSAAEAWRLLGQLRAETGQHPQAVEAYQRALALDPGLVEAHFNLSKSLFALDREAEGRSALRRFEVLSEHAAHIAHLRRALDVDPDDPQTRLALAYHYTRLGDGPAAALHYRAVLLNDPDDVEAITGLSRLLSQEGDPDAALALCLEAAARLDQDPQLYRVIYAGGQAQLAAGRLPQATAAFRRCLALQADYAPAWTRLGQIYQRQNNPGAALQAFQRAVDADSTLAETHLYLGAALARWGDRTGAQAALNRALDADSTLAQAYWELGQLYERSDSTAAAVAAYRSFLTYWDGDPQQLHSVRRSLARLSP